MKTKTIVSVGLSRNNHSLVGLTITDAHSGDRVVTVDFTLEEFALLVTGLYGVKGIADVYADANIAKKRETLRVTCDKQPSGGDKKGQRAIVRDHFENEYLPLGYQLHDDGTTTQQRTQLHQYIVKRYVPVEDVLDVERYY